MSNITINYKNSSIELTKAFANRAKVYNSEEYKLLQKVRKENSGFVVMVVSAKKKSSKSSRITLADMERYISFHDDEQKSKMNEFKKCCNAKENGELRAKNFFEIKKWFFKTFPQAVA